VKVIKEKLRTALSPKSKFSALLVLSILTLKVNCISEYEAIMICLSYIEIPNLFKGKFHPYLEETLMPAFKSNLGYVLCMEFLTFVYLFKDSSPYEHSESDSVILNDTDVEREMAYFRIRFEHLIKTLDERYDEEPER